MNERIRQLALQAGQGELFHIPPEFVEKFSELIVEECYHVVVSNPNIGTSLAGANMKKHFGMDNNNIAAAERLHSDKGYSLGTPEAQEAFDSKRGYNYD